MKNVKTSVAEQSSKPQHAGSNNSIYETLKAQGSSMNLRTNKTPLPVSPKPSTSTHGPNKAVPHFSAIPVECFAIPRKSEQAPTNFLRLSGPLKTFVNGKVVDSSIRSKIAITGTDQSRVTEPEPPEKVVKYKVLSSKQAPSPHSRGFSGWPSNLKVKNGAENNSAHSTESSSVQSYKQSDSMVPHIKKEDGATLRLDAKKSLVSKSHQMQVSGETGNVSQSGGKIDSKSHKPVAPDTADRQSVLDEQGPRPRGISGLSISCPKVLHLEDANIIISVKKESGKEEQINLRLSSGCLEGELIKFFKRIDCEDVIESIRRGIYAAINQAYLNREK